MNSVTSMMVSFCSTAEQVACRYEASIAMAAEAPTISLSAFSSLQ